MISMPLLLAQEGTSESAETATIPTRQMLREMVNRMDMLHYPDELLDRLQDVPFVLGSVLVAVGLLCVFNGYRWHRWVVVILAFMGGLGLGEMLSEEFGRSNIVAVALGCLCAIVATPLLKVAVAIFSGMTGAFIGANLWTAINTTSPEQHWAGAAMGFIALAMASVLLFRLMIVLFTSVGGAAMVVFGGLALMLQVEDWQPAIRDSLMSHELMLPVLVLLAAVGGFVLQEGRSREDAREGDS